jgi:glycosyltransferase involved in cell wall biosynthesis
VPHLNLLAFENCPDNRLGGQERSLLEVLQGLAAQGVEIDLAHIRTGNLESDYRTFAKSLIQLPGPFYFSCSTALSSLRTLAKLVLRHWRHPWGILYVNQYLDIFLPVLLGKLIGRPVVAHLRLPPPNGTFSRQHKWGLNHCTQLIAISHATAHAYRQSGITAPIKVIHNGTNLTHFAPPPGPVSASAHIRVLYLGRVLPDKGVDVLVAACELASKSQPVQLTVVGDPFPTDEGRAYHLSLKNRTEHGLLKGSFLPHVDDVRPFLASADVLVLPSRWPEPFGRVLIEAMASGIPVIASNVGGIPEILNPDFDDHLVPPDDPEALARAILRIGVWRISNPELGHVTRNHVQKLFDANQTHTKVFQALVALPPTAF